MDKMTINEALVMRKVLTERRNQLKELTEEKSTRKRRIWSSEESTQEEPIFDLVAADAKKVEIDLALFRMDSAIKQANAVATITLPTTFDFEALMAPLAIKK
jgi:hypothetical protein